MRIILDIDDMDDSLMAWRAAIALIRDGYKDCIYTYGEIGTPGERAFWARQTKSGVSSRISRPAKPTEDTHD